MNLTQEQLNARIKSARNFSIGDFEVEEPVEIAIRSDTAKKLGFDKLGLSENTTLYRKKDKDGNLLDGYFLVNNKCPVARNLDEAEEIAEVLMPKADGLLDVVNKKLRTEFQNKVRSCLNAVVESVKAVKEVTIQEAADKLAAGEITKEEFNVILKKSL